MHKDIKTIIFDWGGVCCKEGEPFASRALQEFLQLTPDEIAEKVHSVYKGYYIGDYDRDSFWRAILNHFKLKETSEINSVVLSGAYLCSYEIYQDVLDLILEFKKKYNVGLLSNLTPEMRDQVRKKHNLGKYFNTEVYSCDQDVKSMKPGIKPFRVILKKMNSSAEECLFIDNSQKNIEVAAQIGMKTLLFENQQQFFKDIKRFVDKSVSKK